MKILVETYRSVGEPSSAAVRVRALPGQRLSGVEVGGLRVECSRAMRSAWSVGQRFWLDVSLKERQGAGIHLYAGPRAAWCPDEDSPAGN